MRPPRNSGGLATNNAVGSTFFSRRGILLRALPPILLTCALLAMHITTATSQANPSGRSNVPSKSKTAAKVSKNLPPGKGRTLVIKYCSSCHQLTVVTHDRRTRDEWISEIQSMSSKGMNADPEQMLTILDYLSKNFGSAAPRAAVP